MCLAWFFLFDSVVLSLILQNRYGSANVWKIFTDIFDYFPLTALVRSLSFKPFSFLCKPLVPRLMQLYFFYEIDPSYLLKYWEFKLLSTRATLPT